MDIKDIVAPESKSALAIVCLPPGPLTSTWLVIIRQLGSAVGAMLDGELALAATTLTTGNVVSAGGAVLLAATTFTTEGELCSLCTNVWCLPPHDLSKLRSYIPQSDDLGPDSYSITS